LDKPRPKGWSVFNPKIEPDPLPKADPSLVEVPKENKEEENPVPARPVKAF
jgi:hypothetical protein